MTNQELIRLQNDLYRLISPDTELAYVHGTLTAVLCAPDMIMPSTWIPHVLKGEPRFESLEEANSFSGLLMKFYNDIAGRLMNKTFEPFFSLSNKASGPDDAQTWCKGFLRGMILWDSDYTGNDEVADLITSTVMLSDSTGFFESLETKKIEVSKEKLLEIAFDSLKSDILMLHRITTGPSRRTASGQPMEIEEIINELEYDNGYFPREAIEAAIKQKDKIIPELLKILEFSNKNIHLLQGSKKYTYYTGYYMAMYLLSQFEEQRAFPLILDFFTLLKDDDYLFTGDIITEDLQRFLASTYDGNLGSLCAVFENPGLNEYVRTAIPQVLAMLLKYNQLSREQVVSLFKGFLQNNTIQANAFVLTELIHVCAILQIEEVLDDIRQLYGKNIADPEILDLEYFEDIFSGREKYYNNDYHNGPHYSKIDDAIAALEKWVGDKEDYGPDEYEPDHGYGDLQPAQNKNEKIGRNEPCPCGSGKKYKKCCGR